MKLARLAGFSPSLYAFGAMAVALLSVVVIYAVKNAALRDKLANEQLARSAAEVKLAVYKTAAEWQVAKLAEHVNRGDKEYAEKMAKLKAIETGPLPDSPEQARVWALSILLKEEK